MEQELLSLQAEARKNLVARTAQRAAPQGGRAQTRPDGHSPADFRPAPAAARGFRRLPHLARRRRQPPAGPGATTSPYRDGAGGGTRGSHPPAAAEQLFCHEPACRTAFRHSRGSG